MNNPEKLETQGTQDKEKQNKYRTQYVTICKQAQITYKTWALLQTTGGNVPTLNKDNKFIFFTQTKLRWSYATVVLLMVT